MNRVLQLIHGSYAFERGIYGQNVQIAVLDTGISLHHAFQDRIVSFHDMVNGRETPYDDNGHGTHVAGIIGGYHPQTSFSGVAPGCDFHIYKVLDENGNGKVRSVVAAIRDILFSHQKNRIRILNISVGMSKQVGEEERRQLIESVEQAWSAGIIVVAAAGNNGPENESITYPGISKKIITVGSSDDRVHFGNAGMRWGYSGLGPTCDCIVKPEVLAPGTNIKSCGIRSLDSFAIKSGTSMAAPVVTGMIALFISAYGVCTPAEMKLQIYHAVVPAKENKDCWGLLYVDRLLKADQNTRFAT